MGEDTVRRYWDAVRRAYPDKRLILDVEMPDPEAENQEQRTKRIAFYKRNGLSQFRGFL